VGRPGGGVMKNPLAFWYLAERTRYNAG